MRVMNEFWREALAYASDDCQRAFGRMMQGAYGDAPGPVIMRLYAEFVVAARRDLGDESSLLTPTEVFAPKLTVLFTAKDTDVFGFDRGTFSALRHAMGGPCPGLGRYWHIVLTRSSPTRSEGSDMGSDRRGKAGGCQRPVPRRQSGGDSPLTAGAPCLTLSVALSK